MWQIDGHVNRELIDANLVSCLCSAGLDQCSFALIRASGTRNRLTWSTTPFAGSFFSSTNSDEKVSIVLRRRNLLNLSADYSAINLISSSFNK